MTAAAKSRFVFFGLRCFHFDNPVFCPNVNGAAFFARYRTVSGGYPPRMRITEKHGKAAVFQRRMHPKRLSNAGAARDGDELCRFPGFYGINKPPQVRKVFCSFCHFCITHSTTLTYNRWMFSAAT